MIHQRAIPRETLPDWLIGHFACNPLSVFIMEQYTDVLKKT